MRICWQRDVQSALSAADEYVWLWNEQGTSGPTRRYCGLEKPVAQALEVAMPGCDEALRAATDPAGYEVSKAKELIGKAGAVDIARNGSFDPAVAAREAEFCDE